MVIGRKATVLHAARDRIVIYTDEGLSPPELKG